MERDDLHVNDQYPLQAIHSEEAGKAIRKKILFVTVLLTVITLIEVLAGTMVDKSNVELWHWVKIGYVLLTLLKAGYIVLIFMHLGDEKRLLRNFILIPYFFFMFYIVWLLLMEGQSVLEKFNPSIFFENW